jgi:hypothetical protein
MGGVHIVDQGILDRIRILLVLLGAVCGERGRFLASPTAEVLNTQDKWVEDKWIKTFRKSYSGVPKTLLGVLAGVGGCEVPRPRPNQPASSF